jgi:hypothetical protein
VVLSPIDVRTFISIDPSITFSSTIDDLVPNTHSLFTAAISTSVSDTPTIVIGGAVGKVNPLYSINLLTQYQLNPTAYVGSIQLNGEVDTFADQSYRTNTVTADPIAPTTVMTFTVEESSATIAFDLYKAPVPADTYNLTNTNGSDSLVFNGTTMFNNVVGAPIFPTGKWTTVTMGLSLSGQAALRQGGGGNSAPVAAQEQSAPVVSAPIAQQPDLDPLHHTDGATTLAEINNNNNFEVTPVDQTDSSVKVSMGKPLDPSYGQDLDDERNREVNPTVWGATDEVTDADDSKTGSKQSGASGCALTDTACRK